MNGPKKRGPGRPAKATATKAKAATSATSGLDGLLAAVRGAEQERVKMRAALAKIQAVIAGVL